MNTLEKMNDDILLNGKKINYFHGIITPLNKEGTYYNDHITFEDNQIKLQTCEENYTSKGDYRFFPTVETIDYEKMKRKIHQLNHFKILLAKGYEECEIK